MAIERLLKWDSIIVSIKRPHYQKCPIKFKVPVDCLCESKR